MYCWLLAFFCTLFFERTFDIVCSSALGPCHICAISSRARLVSSPAGEEEVSTIVRKSVALAGQV